MMIDAGEEQYVWQLRAHAVLGKLLERGRRDCLPPADWTVAAAGCGVTAHFHQPDPSARRLAFDAWAEALGADRTAAGSLSGAEVLTGKARLAEDDLVRVVLSARVWGGDEEDGGYG